jgi:PAS domain S-box-containing protein
MGELTTRTPLASRDQDDCIKYVYAQSPIGIELYDAEGRLLDANQACLDLFGVSNVEEIRGIKLFEDPNLPQDAKETLRQGKTVEFESLFDFETVNRLGLYPTAKSGSIHIAVLITPLHLKDREALAGYLVQVHDTTRRKQAEAELRRLKEFNEGIVQAMSEGVIVEDVAGCFTFVNPAAATLLGYMPEELVSRHWTAVVPPDQRPIVLAANERRAHGEADRYELELARKDSTRLTALVSGTPRLEDGQFVGALAVFTDITALKITEKALAAERNLLLTVMDNVPDFIFVKDTQSRFVMTNPAHIRNLGAATQDEVIGKTDFDLLPHDLAEQYYADEQKVMQSGQPLLNRREAYRIPGGEQGSLSTTKVPLRDSAGQIRGLVGISRDTTEAMRIADELQKAKDRLEQQNARLEALYRVGQMLNSTPRPEVILDHLTDEAMRVTRATHGQVLVVDEERGRFERRSLYGFSAEEAERARTIPLPLDRGINGRAYTTRGPVCVDDVQTEPGYFPLIPSTRAELAVPIIHDGQVLGNLDLQSPEVGAFRDVDMEFLNALTSQAAIALDRARMFASLRRQAEQIEALHRVSQDLVAIRNLDTLLHQIVERAMQLLDGEGGGIYLYRPQRDALEWAVVVGENPVPLGTVVSRGVGLSGKVWETGEPLFADDYESWAGRMSQVTGFVGAILGVPIRRGDDFLGVLTLWTGNKHGRLTPEDAALASQFAAQAAIAIENARLFEALHVSEERYALAVRGSNDGIYDHDLVSNTLYWSPRMKEMLGYADGELEIDLDTFISFLHPDDVEQAKLVLQSDWRTDRIPHELEQRMRTKSGEYRWFVTRGQGVWDDSGQLVRIAGSVTDITERKRMEEHLQRAKEELQKQNSRLEALYWVGQMINSTLRPDVVLDRLTDEAMRVTRATRGQVLVVHEEQGCYERRSLYGFSPEEAERARTIPLPLDQGVNGRAYVTHQPIRVDDVQAEPGYFPLIASTRTELAVPIIRDGQVLGNLDLQSPEAGAFRDADMEYLSALTGHVAIALTNARLYQQAQQEIAERLRVEEKLRQAKEAAEVATRAKSDFLANMSHEIRTPLNAVIGLAEILSDTELTGEQREYAEVIRTSGDTLLTIINDILDFSKIESGRFELEHRPFNLRDCLEEALDLVAPKAAEKGLEMACIVDEQTPETLVGDDTRLRQVLMNLLSNAVKFTESGEVVVAVTCSVTAEKQRRVHFAVKDTGIGIPPQHMGRLFQSFSQLDASTTRKYGGTGLGLAISKRLSELMGGTMWAESDGLPGHGSIFHFTILAEVAADQEHAYLHGPQPGLAGKRILIVDDNATNQYIIGHQIRAWGMVPREAATGREALARIRDGEPFDAAILDMRMPEMDGLALAAEIRSYRDARTLPLVMLTSLGQAREISRNGGSEFAAYLTKPVKSSQLYSALARILAGQALLAREPASPGRPRIDPTLGERHPLRILLAEDNAANQMVALSQLKKMGYSADVAANGSEVLQALERQPYDLVLMDVQMPEMDGLEAARRIRERWSGGRGPRIIAMTASTMPEDRERCLEAGMDDYISKPVRIEELTAALGRCQPVARPGHRPDGPSASPTPNGKAMAIAKPDAAPGRGTAAHADAAIDTAVLEGLSAGMEEVVPELIDIYFDGALKLLADMRQAVAQGDASLLTRAAHTLKPSSASLGAIPLATLCEELEAMGRAGALESAAEKLAQVEAEYRRVKTALEAIQCPTRCP